MQADPITIDENLCQLCGKCVEVCPVQIFEATEERIDIERPECCYRCGHCVAVCPEDAVSVGEEHPIPFSEVKPLTPDQMLHHIRARRSTRIYRDEPVPKGIIEHVIEAGRYAPTGGNYQSIHFTVVVDPQRIEILREKVRAKLKGLGEMLESRVKKIEEKGEPLSDIGKHTVAMSHAFKRMDELSKQGRDVIFYRAPVVIVLHGEAVVGGNQWNADLIAMCMTLMAESLGLGTCFLGLLPLAEQGDGESLRAIIDLPEGHRIFQGLVMGYPGVEFVKAPGRKPAKVNWM